MNNRYFQLTKKERREFQLKLLMLSLLGMILIGLVLILVSPKLAFLCIIIIAVVITIIAPFFDVPSLIEKGKLKYYSLFLLTEQEKNKTIKIHGGTLFDYYFVFERKMTKQERKKAVLLEYLKGLKNLIEKADKNIKIQGTSYIINERTANKLGLKKVATNGIQTIILLFNYINLTLSISLLNKSIVFPNLSNIITFEGKIIDMKKKEDYIDMLIEKLEKTTANNR